MSFISTKAILLPPTQLKRTGLPKAMSSLISIDNIKTSPI